MALVLYASSVTSVTCGQGLVNFYNTPSTLISQGPAGKTSMISGQPGTYYFALLTSPSGAFDTFSFTGIYGTNLATPGLFTGGAGVPVPGWTPGSPLWYEVAGWTATMGHDFNPQWLVSGSQFFQQYPTGSAFGVSNPGYGLAGGISSTGTLPPLDLFGGTSGFQSGFNLAVFAVVPEPSTAAFLAIGTVMLFVSRRRWARTNYLQNTVPGYAATPRIM